MSRAVLLLALALGCSGTVATERACAVPEDAYCGLPRCSVQVASGACRHITGPVAEVECDRPMATLDQDCANENGPTSCMVATYGATKCEAAPSSDGTTWCCGP